MEMEDWEKDSHKKVKKLIKAKNFIFKNKKTVSNQIMKPLKF